MLATQNRWKSGGRILSLALLGGITFSPVTSDQSHATVAMTAPAMQTWLSLEGPWLCRTWSSSQAVVTGLPNAGTQGQSWQTGVGWFGITDPSIGMTMHCTLQWQVDDAGHVTT